MRMITLTPDQTDIITAAAQVLHAAFVGLTPTWDTLDKAHEEVIDLLTPENIVRVALSDEGAVMGWVGGIPEYDGNVWELHPLAVAPEFQRQGVGRALVQDLVAQVKARGAVTLMLGTDDEYNATSISGIDLYPDPLAHLQRIENHGNHPVTFYQKMGFVITGVIPDANGFGKPDIFMTMRVE